MALSRNCSNPGLRCVEWPSKQSTTWSLWKDSQPSGASNLLLANGLCSLARIASPARGRRVWSEGLVGGFGRRVCLPFDVGTADTPLRIRERVAAGGCSLQAAPVARCIETSLFLRSLRSVERPASLAESFIRLLCAATMGSRHYADWTSECRWSPSCVVIAPFGPSFRP